MARTRLKPLLLAMGLAGLMGHALAVTPDGNALPTLTLVKGTVDTKVSTVKVGDGVISTNAAAAVVNADTNRLTMTVVQTSDRAVWQGSFTVGANAAFNNSGPKGSDTLIYDNSGTTSGIYGWVISDNRLWLVNPSGIYVGSGGYVNATSLLMSARDIDVAEKADFKGFMTDAQAHLHLALGAGGNDYAGGFIEVAKDALVQATGGSVAMVAPRYIHNAGVVRTTKGGTLALHVVNETEVTVGDSGYITLAAPTDASAVNTSYTGRALLNEGSILANDGNIDLLVAGAGNTGVPIGGGTTAAVAYVAAAPTYNGLVNTGAIVAQGVSRATSIKLTVQGDQGMLLNQGQIDASAIKGGTQGTGGSISLTGSNVSVGGTVTAEGPNGGGQIDLVLPGNQDGNLAVNTGAVLSADALTAGNGGTIRLLGDANVNAASTTGLTGARTDGTSSVTVLGTLQARGGTESGNGGQIITTGQVVRTRVNGEGGPQQGAFDVSARNAAGAVGRWAVYSPVINVGPAYALNNANSNYNQVTALYDDDVVAVLNKGANVELGTYASGYTNTNLRPTLTVLDGTSLVSTYAGQHSLTLSSVADVTLGTQNSPIGLNIAASGGPMAVKVVADADQDGTGNLKMVGYDVSQAKSVPGRATAQGSTSQPSLRINSNGGDIDIVGSVADVGMETSGQAVLLSNVNLNAFGAHQSGAVRVSGGLHSKTGTETRAFRSGVQVSDSMLSGSDITIQGRGFKGNGVELNRTMLNVGKGVLTITGLTTVAGESFNHGVALDDVQVNLDGGRMVLLGANQSSQYGGGNGIYVGAYGLDIAVAETSTSKLPQVTIVGSSSGSSSAGLQVDGETGAIRVHDQSGADVYTHGDVALGASADANLAYSAIELGSSKFLTTGRVGVRPTTYSGALLNDPAKLSSVLLDQVNVPIYLGYRPEVSDTNFILSPGLFNGAMGTNLNIIVGSDTQVGRITVADHVFNGASMVTLQNQGAGSQGIFLGAQGGEPIGNTAFGAGRAYAAASTGSGVTNAGTLNLVTTGDVRQAQPSGVQPAVQAPGNGITADTVNVVAGPTSTVDLSNPTNNITHLTVLGGSSVSVPKTATPSSTGSVDVFASGTNSFTTINTTPPQPEPPTPTPTPDTSATAAVAPSKAVVESSEALNETRTDVYVRGQFTRPQVCTPASSGGGAVELDADPLAQQWLQVRRSAQLSTCSSVRNDSNCSAF